MGVRALGLGIEQEALEARFAAADASGDGARSSRLRRRRRARGGYYCFAGLFIETRPTPSPHVLHPRRRPSPSGTLDCGEFVSLMVSQFGERGIEKLMPQLRTDDLPVLEYGDVRYYVHQRAATRWVGVFGPFQQGVQA